MMIGFLIKRVISAVFMAYTLLILARLIGSWFPQAADHPLMRMVATVTDPYLNIFKKFIPPLGMIDLSPLAALFSLQIIEWVLFAIL